MTKIPAIMPFVHKVWETMQLNETVFINEMNLLGNNTQLYSPNKGHCTAEKSVNLFNNPMQGVKIRIR